MNRKELQEIAQIRIREAETLLHNGHFEGAYYLAGYAVECALKACIAKQTHEHDFPDLKWARKVYTHNLEDLLSLAGLEEERKMREKSDPDFSSNWAVVKDWSEEARYQVEIDEQKARDLVNAVTNENSGVLPWLKTLW